MRGAIAAYRLLVGAARADGHVTPEEEALLERYRRAMRLGRRTAQAIRNEPDPEGEALAALGPAPDDRDHLVNMLVRVACADGQISSDEKQWLARVADALGVSRARYAALKVAAVDHVHHRRGRRRLFVGGLTIAGLIVLLAAIMEGLDGPGTTVVAGNGSTAVFQDLQQRLGGSVVLISVEYHLARGSSRVRFAGVGSGFFVSRDGLIATNKHVVQPWKFSPEARKHIDQGYALQAGSLLIRAWPGGTRVFDGPGRLRTSEAYATDAGTLDLLGTPPDVMVQGTALLAGGGTYQGVLHAHDNNDLAVLRAAVRDPVEPLLLGHADDEPGTLDDVLVLGFPHGLDVLEGDRAVVSATVGTIRKAEDSLHITAPISGGNSGGPVLGVHGRVVGVATRKLGESTYGGCIRIRHLRTLVDRLR